MAIIFAAGNNARHFITSAAEYARAIDCARSRRRRYYQVYFQHYFHIFTLAHFIALINILAAIGSAHANED